MVSSCLAFSCCSLLAAFFRFLGQGWLVMLAVVVGVRVVVMVIVVVLVSWMAMNMNIVKSPGLNARELRELASELPGEEGAG